MKEEEKLEYFVCDDIQDTLPLPPRNEKEKQFEDEVVKLIKEEFGIK